MTELPARLRSRETGRPEVLANGALGRLVEPSGPGVGSERSQQSIWAFGPAGATDRVVGPALDFCLLVTQRRHRTDLALVATERRNTLTPVNSAALLASSDSNRFKPLPGPRCGPCGSQPLRSARGRGDLQRLRPRLGLPSSQRKEAPPCFRRIESRSVARQRSSSRRGGDVRAATQAPRPVDRYAVSQHGLALAQIAAHPACPAPPAAMCSSRSTSPTATCTHAPLPATTRHHQQQRLIDF
jgi:Wyosine base formation